MKTFLSENNLSSKTLIPFNSNAGYGIGCSFDAVESHCPDIQIIKGFITKGGVEQEVILFVMDGEKRSGSSTRSKQMAGGNRI